MILALENISTLIQPHKIQIKPSSYCHFLVLIIVNVFVEKWVLRLETPVLQLPYLDEFHKICDSSQIGIWKLVWDFILPISSTSITFGTRTLEFFIISFWDLHLNSSIERIWGTGIPISWKFSTMYTSNVAMKQIYIVFKMLMLIAWEDQFQLRFFYMISLHFLNSIVIGLWCSKGHHWQRHWEVKGIWVCEFCMWWISQQCFIWHGWPGILFWIL